MDVVYTLNHSSIWRDNELRYSLRSMDQFLSGIRNVWIIGHRPNFLNDDVHVVRCSDNYQHPARNIMSKLLVACKQEEISDNFLFVNDDHFLLKHYNIHTFPYFYYGDLKNHLNNLTDYRHTVENTISVLASSTRYFDTHTPIIYNKEQFTYLMKQIDWGRPHGFCIKSLYCNLLGIQGTEMIDGKFFRTKTMEQLNAWFDNHDIWSIDDGALTNFLKRRFEQLYPKKSRWEI